MEPRSSSDILPKVAVLIPEEMRARIFPEVAERALSSFAQPIIATDTELASGQLDTNLSGVSAIITGWKCPMLPRRLLAPEGSVAFVSHAAGSVKPLGVQDALEAGHVRVSHAAPVIAQAVAEFTIAQILAHLRRHREFDAGLRTDMPWFEMRDRYLGQLLGAQDVGIVGLGYVGRSVLNLLRPFGCNIFVFDPFTSDEQATKLGVTCVGLNELFERCGVVSLHAANLPATEGMISRVQLESLRPGSLLVNTARAGLVEQGALIDVLCQGKIFAALDNFDTEPLPEDDAIRQLPNVYLSPHHAGHTRESYVQQGLSAVEEVRRFLSGLELKQEIPRKSAHTLA